MQTVAENIWRLTVPYKDIFTTVYLVQTELGALLFDTASYDEDVPTYILPFLAECGVTAETLKYIFVSHNHADHAGGLQALMKHFPDACIVSRCPRLKAAYAGYRFLTPEDGETLLDVLQVVAIPGHTHDSAAILDARTQTLVTGDCLQLYGIYGSGKWGANITWLTEHKAAIDKLRGRGIRSILAAHEYHPYGYHYEGEMIADALDACWAPLARVNDLIAQYPAEDDDKICERYNAEGGFPTLGAHVVTAVRGVQNEDLFI